MAKDRYWFWGINSPWMHSLLVSVKWNYTTVSEERYYRCVHMDVHKLLILH